MLTTEIKKYIEESVLCWLATSSIDLIPNVSPKEIFTHYEDSYILVANIASPQTVRNIKENNQVCISFIDIFVQKGFQLKGIASIVKHSEETFDLLAKPLLNMTEGKYPFSSITKVYIEHIKPIIAPKYLLYPETTEAEQIKNALETYKVASKMK